MDHRVAWELSPAQLALATSSPDRLRFLEGISGTGKTTAGVAYLRTLLSSGIPGASILIITPQRTLGAPYLEILHAPDSPPGGVVSLLTMGGFAQLMVALFWPLIAEQAGFHNPDQPPVFLTLETAQYYMAYLVKPLLNEGLFDSVTMERNRLFSQIIDNLNKSAVVGFPYTEIWQRLKSAWVGEPGQVHVYEDAQRCASLFREYCLANNLLDFSLQMDVFTRHLWTHPACREFLKRIYRHMIADNIEEDTPIAHDIIAEWLPDLDSALLIYDENAGYRRFLGADPQSAYRLKELCHEHFTFSDSQVTSLEIQALAGQLESTLLHQPVILPVVDPRPALFYTTQRYYPQMLDWITQQIVHLVKEEGVAPGQIVLLAPYLSDALRFSLVNRLQNLNIPSHSHRPSRSLREEPATQCLLTLAALAHPNWKIIPNKYDIAYAFMQAIEGLDLVRAQLLTDIVYRLRDGAATLSSFDRIMPEIQERITYVCGERFERLRTWLEHYNQNQIGELDHFLSLIFGEVLSQPGFGFHTNLDAGSVTARLVESVRKFRWVASPGLAEAGIPIGKEYIEMVQNGVIAAQYLQSWQPSVRDSILIAPAYTFLMSNYPVDVQFWLDAGSLSWSERLYQPLTHPYVLSRHWLENALWSTFEEDKASQSALHDLVLGLLHRCRSRLYLGISELSEQGYEQRGPLLRAFHRVLQSLASP